MTANDALKLAVKSVGKTLTQGAAAIGWTKQQLSNKMNRSSLRVDDFLDILNGIGVEFVMINKSTGTVIEDSGVSSRAIRKQVGRVTYNTAFSIEAANNFYQDGKNKFTDGSARVLYIDREGRYFFVEHSEGPSDTKVIPATAKEAADFIEKFGTTLEKLNSEE